MEMPGASDDKKTCIQTLLLSNNLNIEMISFTPEPKSLFPGCDKARQALADFLQPGNPLNNPNFNPPNDRDRNRLMRNKLDEDVWRACPAYSIVVKQ